MKKEILLQISVSLSKHGFMPYLLCDKATREIKYVMFKNKQETLVHVLYSSDTFISMGHLDYEVTYDEEKIADTIDVQLPCYYGVKSQKEFQQVLDAFLAYGLQMLNEELFSFICQKGMQSRIIPFDKLQEAVVQVATEQNCDVIDYAEYHHE